MNSNKRFRRSAVALAAGASLVFGVAACSDDAEDAKDKAGDAANSATEKAGEAADSATAKAGEGEGGESEAEGSEGADAEGSENADAEGTEGADAEGETEKVQTASGEEVELPKDVKTAWDNEGGESGSFGKLAEFTEGENGSLATFEKGWIANSKDHGAVPLIGKIGETWNNGGGLDNELGLPTAPEKGDAANGWTQSFENGTITWAKDESGQYTETIEKR
ncbi:LGFP repeat-containing protein [Corynebacterium sp. ACRQJ]|uniref:LGFP repeat-containing protein n=1 Tax=Corynebacterium sp. ACRQJ TaxID=2918189 RepID=UPI001EF62645|nr:hypothetical protein [Corynebacterium sp. ACRQJ]MCG7267722.1 hypothetical protein [Corynebacterium sp. ACRQJ]